MVSIAEFETALKDVVNAKRLSQSKMNSLTEIAMKCMQNDTQMVSILYRTHKALSVSGKTASLYAFDALARAARHQANKNRAVADLNSGQGNSATFLLKIEGILDGLFQDLVTNGTDDLKEKAKKILDIWAKSNTFPSAVLSPLFDLLKQAENEKEPGNPVNQLANPTPDNPHGASAVLPNQAPAPQPSVTPPASIDVQSALLALLSKAASAVGAQGVVPGQTAPNTAIPVSPAPSAPAVPALDANQLAFLHQFAQTAKDVGPISGQLQLPGFVPQQPPVSASIVPSNSAVPIVPPAHAFTHVPGGPLPLQPPYRDDQYGLPSAHARESEHQPPQQYGRYGPEAATTDPRSGYSREGRYGSAHDLPVNAPSKPSHEQGGGSEHGYDHAPYPNANFGYEHGPPYAHGREHDPRGDHHRDRPPPPNPRGSYRERGGPGRGRGRGSGGGRWDDRGRRGGGDRDGRDRDYGGDRYDDSRRPDSGRRQSRSRSPGPSDRYRAGGGRGRPYSPPRHRDHRDQDELGRDGGGYRQQDRYSERYMYNTGPDGAATGFDEFGRELRPGSPDAPGGSDSASATQHLHAQGSAAADRSKRGDSPFPPGSGSATASDRGSAAPEHELQRFTSPSRPAQASYPPATSASTSTVASLSPSTSSAPLPHSASTIPASVSGSRDQPQGGLDTFDRAAFDPSQPQSWVALGEAWAATHGAAPTQEQLVQFVFGGMPGLPASASGAPEQGEYAGGYDEPRAPGGRRTSGYYEDGGPSPGPAGGGFRGRGGRDDGDGGYRGGGRGRGYGRDRGGEYGGRGGGDDDGRRGGYGGGRGDY
ncbi:hypothetical protein DICSQDRAFT_111985, partial [Dichomitus squalens LYAD-421 SS1]